MVEHSSSTETLHHEPGLSRQLGLTTATGAGGSRGDPDEILAYFTVPTVVFVGLTVAAVFVLGRGARNTEEPVLVPWHPIPPLLFLVPTAVLLALMAMNKPKHAGIGLAVVLLGLPVYHLVVTRLAPREAPGDASSLAESSPASAAVETT